MKYKTDGSYRIAAVVLCAGRGERTGLTYNKILHRAGSKTVLERVLDVFLQTEVSAVTVVCAPDDLARIKDILGDYPFASVTLGGATRAESVLCGLKATACDIVVIHDGARPFVTPELIARTISDAKEYGSGIAAVPSCDTVKRLSNGTVSSLNRAELYNAQTPQTFVYSHILDAYTRMAGTYTDDAEVYAAAGYAPHLSEGDYRNIKVTTQADLYSLNGNSRMGVGFDVHRLVDGRKLLLGGVTVPHDKGLLGHSDADVLIHAVADALLSAAGLPDIGVLFPDTDPRFEGISSMILLKDVMVRVRNRYDVINVSAVIIAQQPKLASFIPAIRASLADGMGIDPADVNVSATTTEKLGLIGNGDAIAATATAVLTESNYE